MHIVIREFASKEVVDILRPGDSFDAVRVTVYDRKAKRDVTEAAIMSREGEEVKEQSGEWEVCLVNEYPEENVLCGPEMWFHLSELLNSLTSQSNTLGLTLSGIPYTQRKNSPTPLVDK